MKPCTLLELDTTAGIGLATFDFPSRCVNQYTMKQCHNFRRFPHEIFIYAVLKTATKSLLNALQASQSEEKVLFLIRKRNMFDLFSENSLKKTFKSAFRVNFELSHHHVG